jgi:hypothetical protein
MVDVGLKPDLKFDLDLFVFVDYGTCRRLRPEATDEDE